jgi:hypothetical protein
MPSSYIEKVNEVCDISKSKLEKLWDKAKKHTLDSYKIKEKDKSFYPLVVGIFKKSLGKECIKKLKTESSTLSTMVDIHKSFK